MKDTTPNRIFYFAGIGFCAAVYVFMLVIPFFPSIPMVLEGHPPLYLIPWPALSLLFLMISAFLPPGVLCAYLRLRRTTSDALPLARLLLPAAFLPWAFLGLLLPGTIPLSVSGNLLFFLPLLILTLVLYQWIDSFNLCKKTSIRGIAAMLLGGLTILYTVAGIYISSMIGEHDVDEGHYLIQAQSLYEDGDLNIRNNFGFDVDRAITELMAKEKYTPDQEKSVRERVTTHFRAYLHISNYSTDREWRSWHPCGISLLLAPFSGLGLAGRQFILAFISACGCTLLFLLCIHLGRSLRWSLAIILLLAGSCYWVVYSCRSLPEVLGATLFLAAIYATCLAPRWPMRSFVLLILSCVCMVLAHPRFAPCALLAGTCYYLHVLFIHPLRRSTRLTYLFLLLGGLLCGAAYFAFNMHLYRHLTSYQTGGLFWVYPEGAWLILFSERGLFYSLPLAAAMLTALGYVLIRDRNHLLFHVLTALSFFTMIFVIGTSDCWDGGPTMAGRYLLIAVPLLIPATVLLAERTNPFGKCWILLLGLYSCAVTALSLCVLPRIGEGFLRRPQEALKQAIPSLRDLFEPYTLSDIMAGKPYHGWAAFTANPYPVLLLAATLIFVLQRKSRCLLNSLVLILFLAGATLFHLRNGLPAFIWPPNAVEYVLAATPLPGARVISYGGHEAPRLTPFSNRFPDFLPQTLTTRDLGQAQVKGVFSQPRLDQNGWEGKGYRWFTLVSPFAAGLAGPRKITIAGTHNGPLNLYAVIKEGSIPLCYEQIPLQTEKSSFKWSTIVDTGRQRGDIYILFRLEGTGSVTFENITWTPVPPFENK